MFTPFEYQEACLGSIERERQEGSRRVLIVMASGLGKTVTMAFDARKWAETHKGRFLYLCHQNDILYQAKATFQAVLGSDYTYGYFHGQEKNPHGADFLFASLQTMELYKDLFDRNEFAYIAVDESHHSQAPTFRETIEYFKPQFLLGATATPDRLDELDIREIFGEEIFSLPLEEAMAKGYLAPVDYRLITDEIQLSREIETAKGKLSIGYLNRKIFIPRRDEEIAQIIGRYVGEVDDPRTILFCNSIKHCEHLAHFVSSSFSIHSRIPGKEREVRLEMFRHGIINTVLTVDCFNEGIDVPEANVVVFLRSTTSKTIFFQQLGRGLRRAEGKEKVIVLDFVANCERIKMVEELRESVEKNLHAVRASEGEGGIEPMTLNVDSAGFKETIVPILKLLAKIRLNHYLTWQEASAAALKLGMLSSKQYKKRYHEDPRLPSNPPEKYKDFPGWVPFFGRDSRNLYETWREASEAARALGIKRATYRERYKEDPRLPSSPQSFYGDSFPGWGEFTGDWKVRLLTHNSYLTWQEAAAAAKALGITGKVKYRELFKKDPKLPASPWHRYDDFPGWPTFLGKK